MLRNMYISIFNIYIYTSMKVLQLKQTRYTQNQRKDFKGECKLRLQT